MMDFESLLPNSERKSAMDFETEPIPSSLGSFELISTLSSPKQPHRLDPVTLVDFNSNDFERVKRKIYKGGLSFEIRKYCWKYLLEFYSMKQSLHERIEVYNENKLLYSGFVKHLNANMHLPELQDLRSRIYRDVVRTDQDLLFYTGNPQNVNTLLEILMVYSTEFASGIGYVQGMADLASVFLIVFDADATYAFWSFQVFMKRMAPNFNGDGQKMQKHLDKTKDVLEKTIPLLYQHLEKVDSLNLFCCYRWFLVLFRREFSIADICTIWEVIWCSGTEWEEYVYFIAIAILEQHVDSLLQLDSFDEILKYVNSLSMKIRVEEVLERAEFLHLPYQEYDFD